MSASSEFISLCRFQTVLLTQGLGASSSSVYLTENLAEGKPANLVPVVVYPEGSQPRQKAISPSLPATVSPAQAFLSADEVAGPGPENLLQAAIPSSNQATTSSLSLVQQRLVLPLLDQETVLGLLVVSREDRQWSERERVQVEQIANTLAIAYILDQRYQWTTHSEDHQKLTQAQQHEMLADLLHQFRNPLTTLRTLGKLLLKRLRPGDSNREIAESVVRESERLEDLLLQFDMAIDLGEVALDNSETALSRQQLKGLTNPILPPAPKLLPPSFISGVDLPLEPCWIAPILEPLLTSATAIAQERNLHLSAKIPPELPPVKANPQALREVLSNLIDNALKYTSRGGHIWVEVSQRALESEPYQVIAIHDTGPGIPPQDLQHVFERHYRGVQAQTNIPGTGLGLAIAQELVRQMQGKIEVLSPAQPQYFQRSGNAGPGSTFLLWLQSIPAAANPIRADSPLE